MLHREGSGITYCVNVKGGPQCSWVLGSESSNKYWKYLSSKARGSSLSFLLLTNNQMNRCGLAQLDVVWQETFFTLKSQNISDRQQLFMEGGWQKELSFTSARIIHWSCNDSDYPSAPNQDSWSNHKWDGWGKGWISLTSLDLSAKCGDFWKHVLGQGAQVAGLRIPDFLPPILSASGISTPLPHPGLARLKLQVNRK